jgi:phosphoglycolate phosphatase
MPAIPATPGPGGPARPGPSAPVSGFPRAVVFDLDGTLVDTAADLTAALNHVLPRVGRGPVEVAAVRTMVGQGLRRLIERALGATGGIPADADLDTLFEDAFAFYGDHLTDSSQPFPGAVAVLDELRARGTVLGVCTNKPVGFSERLLGALGLAPYFAAILGGDSLRVRKPDAGHLLGTLERMGASTQGAVMVGDSQADIAAARGASVPVVAVSYGYTLIPAAELGADAVIDRLSDLPSVLGRLA